MNETILFDGSGMTCRLVITAHPRERGGWLISEWSRGCDLSDEEGGSQSDRVIGRTDNLEGFQVVCERIKFRLYTTSILSPVDAGDAAEVEAIEASLQTRDFFFPREWPAPPAAEEEY